MGVRLKYMRNGRFECVWFGNNAFMFFYMQFIDSYLSGLMLKYVKYTLQNAYVCAAKWSNDVYF